jgi:hypothetical protein
VRALGRAVAWIYHITIITAEPQNKFILNKYISMETHIQATEDALIETLSFKLPSTANFIRDRRSVTFFPSGSNEYSPRGVKMIKFMMTGTDWFGPKHCSRSVQAEQC